MKHKTWMGFAKDIAENESTCISHKVGCVIVKDGRVISTGYNGTPKGKPNCNCTNAHMVHNGEVQNWVNLKFKEEHHEWSVKNEIHAEMNAIIHADAAQLRGATLYCTLQPCNWCSAIIAGVGIKRVIYLHKYHRTEHSAVLSNVDVKHYSEINEDEKA